MTSPASSSDVTSQTSQAFGQLHVDVRRWIWENGWTELRDIQEQAIARILNGGGDTIIAAATASGKTEAAFLPICSQIVGDARGGVRALYISPLKALINDQFRRLEQLCEQLDIPVHRWHGDVATSKKHRALGDPGGILLITPESLEALFILHGSSLPTVFARLDYVVIDELHAFIGTERGRQLQSLIHRLDLVRRRSVPRIGLSATLGDLQLAAEFLRPGNSASVARIVSSEGTQQVRIQVRGYVHRPDALLGAEGTSQDEFDLAAHLFSNLRGHNNLVFANSRQTVEKFADLLRTMSEQSNVSNEFLPHHGNLSRGLRQDVEDALKASDRPLTVVCTSTLEMGIDIGSVATTAQIGCPPSVSSLRQRLGRSGRCGEPAAMRVYIQEQEITDQNSLLDTLHPELFQAIAMLELLLTRWCEPPVAETYHFSTLVQQLLSIIAERGGIRAADAWKALCLTGPFRRVDQRLFARFLRALAAHDLITQAGDGMLIPGLAGERLIGHYSFYAAFSTPDEYRLMASGRILGKITVGQPVRRDALLIFAGRRWRVTAIHAEQRTIDVVPASGGKVPMFLGTSAAPVHDRVRQEMKALYESDRTPKYLDAAAKQLFREGREYYQWYALGHNRVVRWQQGTLVFPWAGDRIMATIALQLSAIGLNVALDGVAIYVGNTKPDDLIQHLNTLAAAKPPNPTALAEAVKTKVQAKHDGYLSEELLAMEYGARSLDPEGARQTLGEIVLQSKV